MPFSEEVLELTEFATIRRYEGSVVKYSEEEIIATLKCTEELLEWCLILIKQP